MRESPRVNLRCCLTGEEMMIPLGTFFRGSIRVVFYHLTDLDNSDTKTPMQPIELMVDGPGSAPISVVANTAS